MATPQPYDNKSEAASLDALDIRGDTGHVVILRRLKELDGFQLGPLKSKLCQYCRAIDLSQIFQRGPKKEKCLHSPNVQALKISADTCEMCGLMLRALLRVATPTRQWNSPKSFQKLQDAILAEKLDWNGPLPMKLVFSYYHGSVLPGSLALIIEIRGEGVRGLHIFAYPDSSTAQLLPAIPIGMPTHEYSDRSGHFHLLSQWIHSCIKSHKRCRFPKYEPSLPTRVLDVTYPLRLVKSKGKSARYTTLSHCWGGHQPFTTTRANLESRMEGINFNHLPKTFRDAIFATRSLGIRYLWIDSICIVQDDPKDWDSEALVMSSIYANSHCTLAATSAENATVGFLGQRQGEPCVRLESPQTGSRNTLSAFVDLLSDPEMEVTNSCLNKRAWVVQERMLSPRILHFTSKRTYWECDSLFCAEGVEEYAGTNRRFIFSHDNQQISTVSTTPEGWFDLVDYYSQCGLSFDKDKLIAISGLVSRMGQFTRRIYAAGLWDDCIHRGLLWCSQEEPLGPLPGLKLPSWSWASYSGAIQHFQIHYFEPSEGIRPRFERSGSPVIDATILLNPAPRLRVGSFHSNDVAPRCSELRRPTRFRNLYIDEDASTLIGWVSLDRDREGYHSLRDTEWVVVARNLIQKADQWTFSVLLVERSTVGDTFRRKGVGMLIGENKWVTRSGTRPVVLV